MMRISVVAAALLLLSVALTWASTSAQGGSDWSTPELIYETTESIDAPYLSSDQAGVTHLVWRESTRGGSASDGGLDAIFYTNDLDGRLGEGRDIIAMNGITGPTVASDGGGMVHLVWRGSGSTLFHSLSNAPSARLPQGWMEPVIIATSNANAQVVVDSDTVAQVVFPGTAAMSGIYYSRYDAGDDTWIAPVMISLTMSQNAVADFTRMAIGPKGALHVVWTEYQLPDNWPPLGVYYARSTDEGLTWSRPEELEGEGSGQANIAVDSRGRVHAVWNRMAGIGGRYHKWSADGGLAWSPLIQVAPPGYGGTEGPPQLAFDSAETLHLLTTYRGCAWYVRWGGNVWSEPVCISGQRAMASGSIEQPALSIANGNELHAVFWDDRSRLWHTVMMTDSPFIPPVAVNAAATGEIMVTPSPEPTAEPEPTATYSWANAPEPGGEASIDPGRALFPAAIVAGAVLALLLIVIVNRQGRTK